MTTRISKDEDPMNVARTVLPDALVQEPLYECANCGKLYNDGGMEEIKDFCERHSPGDMVAAGECPDCHALCFPAKAPSFGRLAQIEDIIVNQYGSDDEPFTKKQLARILDAIVDVLDRK